MSVLAKNLKTIRKELGCNQSVMADILKVGFRTYVRYEAGERDAPVSVLVKMARLGNISLEQLLTTQVSPHDLAPVQAISKTERPPEVRSVNFRKGQVNFKKPSKAELITVDNAERKLLSLYRKMDANAQKTCLQVVNDSLKDGKGKGRGPRSPKGRDSSRSRTAKTRGTATRSAPARTAARVKKKGRPGRKKVNQKLLREKIDRLKTITRSVSKVTVR